ncbi:MAG: Shedu anti-phage system protein SduA domain-containing protein [Candidatus Pacearchaeota archaeon]|jgi:hypothetical protein
MKKNNKKPSKKDLEDFPKLEDEYETILKREDYVSIPKNRLKTALFVEDKKTKEKKIRLIDQWPVSQFQKGGGSKYVWRRKGGSKSYSIRKDDNISLLFRILRFFGSLLGKRDEEFEKMKDNPRDIEDLSLELAQTQDNLSESQQRVKDLSRQLILKEEDFRKQRDKKFKDNIDKFKKDISEFKSLLDNFEKDRSIEQDLQKYIESHPWFLGLYYRDFTPQKIAGMNRFDFYLKKFDNSEEVIELKRPDAKFMDSEGKISKEFAEAIDQTLRYFDMILDISSQTRLNKKYKISEFYPRGIIVFGYNPNSDEEEYLKRWRNALGNAIEIQTYDQILNKAITALDNLNNNKEENVKC